MKEELEKLKIAYHSVCMAQPIDIDVLQDSLKMVLEYLIEKESK